MQNYDPTKLSKFITFFDMNNLYGGFTWLKSVDNFDVSSVC